MKISVVVAVYNVQDYLDTCVKSLVNQDFHEAEFILVDDGSIDQSKDICDKWEKQDSRIRVIHKPNGGLSDARNAGISAAIGEYIMFLDGDDVLDLNTLKTLYDIAIFTDPDFIQYAYREAPDPDLTTSCTYEGKYELVTDRREMFLRLYNLGGCAASGCTKLIRRSLFERLKFQKDKLHEDEFFTTELLSIAKRVTYVTSFAPYQYIMRDGSIIRSGFNAKRVDDLSEMYHIREMKLLEMGFPDLAELFRTRYFSCLYFQYLSSRNAQAKECRRFIEMQIKTLTGKKIPGIGLELKAVRLIPEIALPCLYFIRKLMNKHPLDNR